MKNSLIFFVVLGLTTLSLLVFDKSCEKKANNAVVMSNKVQAKAPINSGFPVKTKWTPSSYQGLTPGISTYNDVKKSLGNPRWEGGSEEQTFESDPEVELLLQYSNVGSEQQGVEVIVGKKTKLVKAISFYPNPEITKQEAILKYGSDYFETSAGESVCIKDNPKREVSEKHLNYPILLVYPERGMTITVGEDNTVTLVSLLYKCIE